MTAASNTPAARGARSDLGRIAALSLFEAADDPALQRLGDVRLATKELTIEAPVRTFDGGTVVKRLAVTLRRAVPVQGPSGRWVVTKVADLSSQR